MSQNTLTSEQRNDLKILTDFVRIYCTAKHRELPVIAFSENFVEIFGQQVLLCSDCRKIVLHAMDKRRICPLEPKPSCKKCHVHCYSSEYRAKIREIMRYSGLKLLIRGRLDYLWHYFF